MYVTETAAPVIFSGIFMETVKFIRKLLNVSCPNLPQIMEVGEKDGKTALLEEYVQGDTLSEILEAVF